MSKLKKIIRLGLLILFSFLILSLLYFSINKNYKKHKEKKEKQNYIESTHKIPKLQVGDLIFREGKSVDSLIIKKISGSKYSHIGYVVETYPKIKIIHATTDDFPDRMNQVLLSSLSEFLEYSLSSSYLVIRPLFLSKKQKQNIAKELIKKKGQKFILTSKEKKHLYCTTLIFDEIKKETKNFAIQWESIDIGVFKGYYLLPNAFFKTNNKVIYEY